MTDAIDENALLRGFDGALASLAPAASLGRSLAPQIDRIVFVAHGSANRAMLGMQYWIERESPSLEVRRYFPSELMAQNPRRLDARTLVLIASKSGTTQETVAAAEWLRDKPCHTVVFTQRADKPLASLAQHLFTVGETAESFIALFMAMQSLVGGVMQVKDGWPLADALFSSLHSLPTAVVDTAMASDARGITDAGALQHETVLYEVAAGPVYTTAYVWGVCIVMEMLRLHSTALEAAEFFHGPFEVVDDTTPLVLLLGEDPSRPLMERTLQFCQQHARKLFVYDSRDYAMPGIAPEIRAIVAPYILQTALKRITARLSVLLGRPLTERRFMGKIKY